jgi:hypothetical protein
MHWSDDGVQVWVPDGLPVVVLHSFVSVHVNVCLPSAEQSPYVQIQLGAHVVHASVSDGFSAVVSQL